MGGNRRYDLILGSVDRMVQRWHREPQAVELTHEMVQGTGRRRDAEEPVAVRAWLPRMVSYVEYEEIQGEAVAWTPDAVLVRWEEDGRERHTWVWASAVNRL